MRLNYLIGGLIFLSSSISFGQELLPDQNPNYQSSQDYYMENSASLTANESQTVQDTYVAYDWTTAKAERKQERRDRRYEYRRMRFEARNRCCNYNTNQGFYGSPYGNGYYNGYNNGYNYNMPYYNNSYAPYLFGAGLYSLFF